VQPSGKVRRKFINKENIRLEVSKIIDPDDTYEKNASSEPEDIQK
jgi:hypothetical protein